MFNIQHHTIKSTLQKVSYSVFIFVTYNWHSAHISSSRSHIISSVSQHSPPRILCKHPKTKRDKIKYLLLLRIMTNLLKHDLISVGKNITLISVGLRNFFIFFKQDLFRMRYIFIVYFSPMPLIGNENYE